MGKEGMNEVATLTSYHDDVEPTNQVSRTPATLLSDRSCVRPQSCHPHSNFPACWGCSCRTLRPMQSTLLLKLASLIQLRRLQGSLHVPNTTDSPRAPVNELCHEVHSNLRPKSYQKLQ